MNSYDSVYVVLVYKNTAVLEEFFDNLNPSHTYKVIVVNGYFDDESLKNCQLIASKHDADFIAIDNLGYGGGNNVGIDYALNHYKFKYLILSNSDIIIEDINYLDKIKDRRVIIAPDIRMIIGKKQNPHIAYYTSLYYNLLRIGYQKSSTIYVKMGFMISRITRELFGLYSLFYKKEKYKIFSAHGAFIIFTYDAVKDLFPVFNNRMFLYNEELYLGIRARDKNIPIVYCPNIRIKHYEGASAGSDFNKLYDRYRDSFLVLDNTLKKNSQ